LEAHTNNRNCPYCYGEKVTKEYKKINASHILLGFEIYSSMKKCGTCGSLYLNYAPSRDELSELYDTHFQYSAEYSRATINQYKQRLQKLIPLGASKNCSFLEIGCAGGNWLLAAKELGWNAEGNDLNEDMLRQVSKEIGANTHSGFFEDIDFGNKYDVIIAMNVFEHLIEPHALLKKLSETLTKGGLFMMKTPLSDSPSEKLEGKDWIHLSELGHIQFGSKKAISDLFLKYGFDLLQYESAGFLPRLSAIFKNAASKPDKIKPANTIFEPLGRRNQEPTPKRSALAKSLANLNLIKPAYFYILNLLDAGDSSYWIFRKQ
jgi:2-polyprenyl-3-methyl-5-hydroxy-6-metoxy-1,4-benzoquinol methylase